MKHKPNFMLAIGIGPKRGAPPRWDDEDEMPMRGGMKGKMGGGRPDSDSAYEATESPEQERMEHMTGREGKLAPERALLLPSGARCDNCAYFLADQSACEKVDGVIEPDMVCGVYYEPMGGASEEGAPEFAGAPEPMEQGAYEAKEAA